MELSLGAPLVLEDLNHCDREGIGEEMDDWNPAPTSRCDRCGKEYPAEELGSYYSRHFARKSGRICGDCVADFALDIANAGFRARALGALEERGEQ